ncbi:hypothetical protein L198_07985 [Cryptococcus wingfieldii CBS 7118]|uniref:Uncharacterized protein n=1 Tax=Cryptococcus wingfieldii CBS 7118 TaxID=1295528 RepID=A0A1E3HR74_9TREE|nr:hypothetical protein L198_07985 [Cryptococcus wingfieldii CBS 7118]ODN78196.1 hypothetical protein L198_07985 [Cryptococcus wingfieldii CBS 7118]
MSAQQNRYPTIRMRHETIIKALYEMMVYDGEAAADIPHGALKALSTSYFFFAPVARSSLYPNLVVSGDPSLDVALPTPQNTNQGTIRWCLGSCFEGWGVRRPRTGRQRQRGWGRGRSAPPVRRRSMK